MWRVCAGSVRARVCDHMVTHASRWLTGCMGFVWVHAESFLHGVASSFHFCNYFACADVAVDGIGAAGALGCAVGGG